MPYYKDYYAILNITRFATHTEVRAAYLKRCKECHPDKNPGKDTTRLMQDVNEAKSVLLDPALRANFDSNYSTFKNNGKKEQQQNYTKADGNFDQRQKTAKNRQRYEELKRRCITFKQNNPYLYTTHKELIKKKSTQEIISICDNWTKFSVDFIDLSIYELHEFRKYGLDFIYSRIKEKPNNVKSEMKVQNVEQLPWWGTWLLWIIISGLIRAASSLLP